MIRGVNLGGWLLLERWITPEVFGGSEARDEYTLCKQLGNHVRPILALHRDNFITEKDFAWIASHDLNAVRLPVGYWVFGDEKPFVGCIEYVDKALEWAERYGLKVLLDLHGAPGSQNGNDHSGQIGDIAWGSDENIDKSLAIIERLAKRYKGSDALLGVELINEPSWINKQKRLKHYYQEGYDRIRAHCGTNVWVVASDAYKPTKWKRVMQDSKYQQKMLDVHLYQCFGDKDKKLSLHGHLDKAAKEWQKLLHKVHARWPIIVGEWSAEMGPQTLKDATEAQKVAAYRAYAAAQLAVYEAETDGWFYWNYRTHEGGSWSYRDGVAQGWLPAHFNAKS